MPATKLNLLAKMMEFVKRMEMNLFVTVLNTGLGQLVENLLLSKVISE
jgi:hypothetical protein